MDNEVSLINMPLFFHYHILFELLFSTGSWQIGDMTFCSFETKHGCWSRWSEVIAKILIIKLTLYLRALPATQPLPLLIGRNVKVNTQQLRICSHECSVVTVIPISRTVPEESDTNRASQTWDLLQVPEGEKIPLEKSEAKRLFHAMLNGCN